MNGLADVTNTPQVFRSHASVEGFHEKVEMLQKAGWTVEIEGEFKNFNGNKFITFSYHVDPDRSKVAHITGLSPLHHRVADLMKENF